MSFFLGNSSKLWNNNFSDTKLQGDTFDSLELAH